MLVARLEGELGGISSRFSRCLSATYRKLPGLIIITNVYHMHRVLRRRNLDRSGGAQHVVDEGGEAALLAKRACRLDLAIAREALGTQSAVFGFGRSHLHHSHDSRPEGLRGA